MTTDDRFMETGQPWEIADDLQRRRPRMDLFAPNRLRRSGTLEKSLGPGEFVPPSLDDTAGILQAVVYSETDDATEWYPHDELGDPDPWQRPGQALLRANRQEFEDALRDLRNMCSPAAWDAADLSYRQLALRFLYATHDQ